MEDNVLFPSLFEDDYLYRSVSNAILTQPDVALTELVANAWDAGASHIVISIPENINQQLYIEDDGVGMTETEFRDRWMKLRYNRTKNQGRQVIFPEGVEGHRIAFGRNGVGRHGLFCFGEQYKVITKRDGLQNTFVVKPNVQQQPFAVIEHTQESTTEHGTRLEVLVTQNLPKYEKIVEILSARFLHDPQFKITVNHTTLNLEDLTNNSEPVIINVPNTDITLTVYFIDTTKASRKSIFQGIAFWQGGRLVGEPSWVLGKNLILDGRTTLAKQYTFIVKTNDLADYVKEDWSGFKQSDEIDAVYATVENVVNECFEKVVNTTTDAIQENLSPAIKQSLKTVNPLVQREIKQVIADIVEENPKVKQESVDVAVQAVINLEKTKSGHNLLEKLSQLNPEDIEGLNSLLDNWTISDALVVLNEIDRRLTIISAIRKLAKDKTTDELHVLHPMIAEARWLFGPEYESSEYIFNRQLKNATDKIFGEDKYYTQDANYRKRADLICLPNSTIGITGLEDITSDIELVCMRKILLIELKRGGFQISRTERNQAGEYVEILLKSNMGKNCQITAFVVGDSIADDLEFKTTYGNNNNGAVFLTTYDQLVDTAERRMFGLRQKIANRYDDVPGMELYAQINAQTKLKLN